MPRIVPAVVLFAERFTSVPLKSPVLWMFTAFPVNAFVPVSTLSSVPVPSAPVVATFTPMPPAVVPAPAVSVLPLAIVVLLRVVAPVNVLSPATV